MSIAQRVTEIIAAQALRDPAQLHGQMSMEEIGLDSLGLVEAIFAIEETFDISVPFNPNAASNSADSGGGFEAATLADIIQSIEALVKARG